MRQLPLLFAAFFSLTMLFSVVATARPDCQTALAVKTDSIVLENAVLYYYTYGSGTPIVILSGGPGIGAFQESNVAKNLCKTYQAVLFEQWGTGRSWTKPLGKTTINLATAIDDLDRLRTRLGVDKLSLYGHSWGGMLASAYSAQYPERVRTLVLSGPDEINVQRWFIADANMRIRRALYVDSLKYWSDSVNVRLDPERTVQQRRRLSRAPYVYDTKRLDQYGVQISKGKANDKVLNLMWTDLFQKRFNLDSTLPAYKGPALIVFGRQDALSMTTFYSIKQVLPQAKVQGINFCGHMASIKQPEQFFVIVNHFLRHYLSQ